MIDRADFDIGFVAFQPPSQAGRLGMEWRATCRLAGGRSQQRVHVVFGEGAGGLNLRRVG